MRSGPVPVTGTPSAATRVYSLLKTEILDGARPGGSFVTEGEIAAATGVSRTPVREALLRLEVEGLVRLYPKKGALVVLASAHDAREVLEARLLIEEWAAATMWPRRREVLPELASVLAQMRGARRARDLSSFVSKDRRFHEVIVAAAGNSVLTRTYRGLRDRQLAVIAAQMGMSQARVEHALQDHAQLLCLLETGTRAAFVRATREHVQGALAALQARR